MKSPTLAARLGWAIRHRWQFLVGVLPGVAVALLSDTLLAVPQAEIIDALDTDRYRIHWITGSYTLGSALGMALTGFVASRVGLRRAYLLGIVLFAMAAGVCGFSDEIVLLTPLRFLQGLGNGVLICAAMLMVWRAFPRHREFGMALYGMAVFVPMAAGAVLGGLLTAELGWQWIFWVNLPLGCMAFLLGWALLPVEVSQRATPHHGPLPQGEREKENKPVRLDLIGLALLAGSIITLNVLLDMGQYWGWLNSRQFVLWLSGFGLFFGCFIAWGLLAAKPLINLHVFGHWNTTLALVVKTIFSINLAALVALLAAYMVDLRGYQWQQAALVILPAVLAMPTAIVCGIIFGSLRNGKLRIAVGLTVMSLATWQFGLVDMYTSKFWLAGVLGVWGLGAGLVIGPALLTIFEGLPLADTAMLAGVFNICRSLPAYVATITLVTLWTQHTDRQFDNLRQSVQHNVPIVEASYRSAQQHFVARGSGQGESVKQSHSLLGSWTHDNSRAFALEDVMRDLALITAAAVLAAVMIRSRDALSRKRRCAARQ